MNAYDNNDSLVPNRPAFPALPAQGTDEAEAALPLYDQTDFGGAD